MKFLLSILLINVCLAQHTEQPVKESTDDLRNQSILFRIEDVNSKRTFQLERDPSLSYSLRRFQKKDEIFLKIDSREGQKLDRLFAERFLKAMYLIPDSKGECEVTLRLNMKGEDQNLCKKDDKKTREFDAFVKDLASRF